MVKLIKLLKNQKGATAMQGIGNKLNTTFNNVSNSLS